MPFQKILSKIPERCEGVQAVFLMDLDGVPIETLIEDNQIDSESLGVECARIVSETQKMSSNLESGHMNELVLGTDQGTIVMRPIGETCFLAVLMQIGSNYGKGRYLARIAEFNLLPELT